MALETVGGPIAKEGVSRLTTEYLYWPINTNDDLTGTGAAVAFTSDAETKPVPADWNTAEMVNNPDGGGFAIRLLVGPENDAVDLTPPTTDAKTYHVWVRLTTEFEIIVRRAGTLRVR